MKKKNHSKKALTAVGAVVAAGLAPGIVGAAPVQAPSPELTAADVVAIDGNTYGFDELLAMQQPNNGQMPDVKRRQQATRYGVPAATAYGVPRPLIPQQPQQPPTVHVVARMDTLQMNLLWYCAQLINADATGIFISLDSDLTRDLGMNEEQLKELAAEIKERYGVEVSYHRFRLTNQLNTLRLISEYIYKIQNIWN